MTAGTLRILRALDEACAKRLPPDVSCKAGCSGCCHQVVYSSFAEAVLVLDTYPTFIASLRGHLDNAAARMLEGGATPESEFGIPCALLDSDAGLCRIYPVRPAGCRGYFSVSDPELCKPPKVQIVKLADTSQETAEAIVALTRMGGYPQIYGPLSVMLLGAIEWRHGAHRFSRFLRRLGIGRLDARKAWMISLDDSRDDELPTE